MIVIFRLVIFRWLSLERSLGEVIKLMRPSGKCGPSLLRLLKVVRSVRGFFSVRQGLQLPGDLLLAEVDVEAENIDKDAGLEHLDVLPVHAAEPDKVINKQHKPVYDKLNADEEAGGHYGPEVLFVDFVLPFEHDFFKQ